MLKLNGNIWYFNDWNFWIVIPTNGITKRTGQAVMGAGLAKQAAKRFPFLPLELGRYLKAHGNRVFAFPAKQIFTFPVKHDWREDADLELIKQSAEQLLALVDKHELKPPFYLPCVGCGNGKRTWEEVEPILKEILDDRFVVVFYKS